MSSTTTIFGLTPFEPKRVLILPSEGGEISLYVSDGRLYVDKRRYEPGYEPGRSTHFEGWSASFHNGDFCVPDDLVCSVDPVCYIELEIVFRLVPHARNGQTPEVVAISLDGCETFYSNELSKLPAEYAEPSVV